METDRECVEEGIIGGKNRKSGRIMISGYSADLDIVSRATKLYKAIHTSP